MAGKDQRKGGRYTPKGGGTTPPSSRPASSTSNESTTTPQIGRRPSPPWFLALIALLWVVVGIVVWVRLDAAWKLIPTVVFIGIGAFYLRGALQTVVRHDERTGDPEP
jgi:hypothetical protein